MNHPSVAKEIGWPLTEQENYLEKCKKGQAIRREHFRKFREMDAKSKGNKVKRVNFSAHIDHEIAIYYSSLCRTLHQDVIGFLGS